MTEVVWFRQQNNTNSFIVHFVCMNRHLKVVNHQVQVIEIINKVIMGIDKSSVEEKELVLELLWKDSWNEYSLQHITNVRVWIFVLWRKSYEKNLDFNSRPADVLLDLQLFKMSFISLNKLPFLYCHDKSLTINISHTKLKIKVNGYWLMF